MPDTAQAKVEKWIEVNFKSGTQGFDSVPLHHFFNPIVEAHMQLGSDTKSVVQMALEKSRALPGENGEAILAMDKIFGNADRDPIQRLSSAKDALAKYTDSPVISSLNNCLENIEGLHAILSSPDIASKSRRDGAWGTFCMSIENVIMTAHKARFAEKEFQVLFDDPSFQDAKLEWENSRNAWTNRIYDFKPLDKVEKIEEPLARLSSHLQEYSKTIGNDEQKGLALSEMVKRVGHERSLLEVEKVMIQIEDINHAKRMQEVEETTLKPMKRMIEKFAAEEEAARVTAEAKDREVKKSDAIESIAVNSIHLLEENLGKSRLDKDQKYQLTKQIRKYLEKSDVSTIRANHPEIVEELTSSMRANISTSILGSSVKIKAGRLDNIKSTTLDKKEIEHKLSVTAKSELGDLAKAAGQHVAQNSDSSVVPSQKPRAISAAALRRG